MSFAGKVAIVTGGTRGIGRRVAELLLESGCQVICTGTQEAPSTSVADARYHQLNFLDKENIDSQVHDIFDGIEALDILVNNAGYQHYISDR